ncbi:MAG: hypothetical protein H7Y13_17725 [Sphingobacteriaceae bacterium]|nr:hypothetical protein [Sphingobacteriaceae bacterium]
MNLKKTAPVIVISLAFILGTLSLDTSISLSGKLELLSGLGAFEVFKLGGILLLIVLLLRFLPAVISHFKTPDPEVSSLSQSVLPENSVNDEAEHVQLKSTAQEN